MQQYAGVYLLQNYSTCLGCLSHPSSGVHQTVTAAPGTGHVSEKQPYILIRSNECNNKQVFIYCKITLPVSGVYRIHHQEYIKL